MHNKTQLIHLIAKYIISETVEKFNFAVTSADEV